MENALTRVAAVAEPAARASKAANTTTIRRARIPSIILDFAHTSINNGSKDMAVKNPELLPGTLDMLILKTLARAPNHGYGIAQYIQRISEDALRASVKDRLYPALQRLLVSEWVKAEWGTSDSGRKVRMYTITPSGRKQLQQETRDYGFLIAGIARVMEAK